MKAACGGRDYLGLTPPERNAPLVLLQLKGIHSEMKGMNMQIQTFLTRRIQLKVRLYEQFKRNKWKR